MPRDKTLPKPATSDDYAYFDAEASLCPMGCADSGNELVKDAILIVEGQHKDNKGIVHQFPISRIKKLATNTNNAIDLGYEVPLMLEHSKQLFGANGEIAKLGNVVSKVTCRIIKPSDVPDSLKSIIGKYAAFAKVAIKHRLAEARQGLFNKLSPGVDLINERLGEVSAVAFPAINGPSLLFSAFFQGNTGTTLAKFSLDYDEAKEQAEVIKKQKDSARECLDILFNVVKSIEAVPLEQMMGNDPVALKRLATDKFIADLMKVLGLEQEFAEEAEQMDARKPMLPSALAHRSANYSRTGQDETVETDVDEQSEEEEERDLADDDDDEEDELSGETRSVSRGNVLSGSNVTHRPRSKVRKPLLTMADTRQKLLLGRSKR